MRKVGGGNTPFCDVIGLVLKTVICEKAEYKSVISDRNMSVIYDCVKFKVCELF